MAVRFDIILETFMGFLNFEIMLACTNAIVSYVFMKTNINIISSKFYFHRWKKVILVFAKTFFQVKLNKNYPTGYPIERRHLLMN